MSKEITSPSDIAPLTGRIDPRDIPIRFSNLKAMSRSPLHYEHHIAEGRPDSAGMRLGRLVHWRVLGALPDDEDGKIVVYDGERRGNAWKDFAAANEGADIVTAKEYEESEPIARAVSENEIAAPFVRGEFERRILWKFAGRDCSGRLDVIGRANFGRFVTDLKTTADASPRGFERLALRMNYHAQLAWYSDAMQEIGEPVEGAYIVAVETKAPFAVTTFRLTPALLEEGRKVYRSWFESLRNCEESAHWPGYAQTVVTLDVPAWMSDLATEEDGGEEEAAQ